VKRIGGGEARVKFLKLATAKEQGEPRSCVNAEVMLALGAHLVVLVQIALPDDLLATFAFQPQTFGPDAFFARSLRFAVTSQSRPAFLALRNHGMANIFSMAWFAAEARSAVTNPVSGEKRVRTEGLWLKCESCQQIIWKRNLDENHQVCPQCEHHFRIDARARLALLFDGGEFEELDSSLTSTDLFTSPIPRNIPCVWRKCKKPRRCRTRYFPAGGRSKAAP